MVSLVFFFLFLKNKKVVVHYFTLSPEKFVLNAVNLEFRIKILLLHSVLCLHSFLSFEILHQGGNFYFILRGDRRTKGDFFSLEKFY